MRVLIMKMMIWRVVKVKETESEESGANESGS